MKGKILVSAFISAFLWGSATHALVIYVDDDNIDGPWQGTPENPFNEIHDALDASMSGDTVLIAQGVYHETLSAPSGIYIRGGYSSGWAEWKPFSFMTEIAGGGGAAGVVLNGDAQIKGLVIRNAETGVYGDGSGIIDIEMCSFESLQGADGYPGGSSPPGDGNGAYGVHLTGFFVVMENNIFSNISGGDGGDGTYPNYTHTGGNGGEGCAIFLDQCTDIQLNGNAVSNIHGGDGGDGGWNSNYSADGGEGGDAWGVRVQGSSATADYWDNSIAGIYAGKGGGAYMVQYTAGDGGHGGKAAGIFLNNFGLSSLHSNEISIINGGLGGSGAFGGPAGSGDGGDGGGAAGFFFDVGTTASMINNLVYSVTGGNGAAGAWGPPGGPCGHGGDGGYAYGTAFSSSIAELYNNTLNDIEAGKGGDGGRRAKKGEENPQANEKRIVFRHNDPRDTNRAAALSASFSSCGAVSSIRCFYAVRKNQYAEPATTQTPEPDSTATATPTPTGGPGICCGVGGDGGFAAGIHSWNSTEITGCASNVIMGIIGGNQGQCFSPSPGEGDGVHYEGSPPLDTDYNNVLNCETADYYNVNPGPNSISEDPHWTSGPNGDFYLSSISGGQETDSPCLNAGDVAAEARNLSENYTVQTDHAFDQGIVDMGYHYRLPPIPSVPAMKVGGISILIAGLSIMIFTKRWN